jgi:hypothetical protein
LTSFSVIPAQAGIQAILGVKRTWMPAGVYPEHCRRAGMTDFHFASRRGILTNTERDINSNRGQASNKLNVFVFRAREPARPNIRYGRSLLRPSLLRHRKKNATTKNTKGTKVGKTFRVVRVFRGYKGPARLISNPLNPRKTR